MFDSSHFDTISVHVCTAECIGLVFSLFLNEVYLNMCFFFFFLLVGFFCEKCLFLYIRLLKKTNTNNFLLNFWTQSVFVLTSSSTDRCTRGLWCYMETSVDFFRLIVSTICLGDSRTTFDLCPAGPALRLSDELILQ